MSHFGPCVPRAIRGGSRAVVAAVVCALALSGCGSGSGAESADSASTQTASASPTRVQLQEFPDGTTYWRSAAGAPIVAHKAGSQLCFFYWAGYGDIPLYSGSMAEVLKQWNWTGFMGTSGFGGAPKSTSAATLSFSPAADKSGNWDIKGAFGFDPEPVAEGSPDPASDRDLWIPTSRQQAAEDYATFLGLQGQQFEAPTLASCPTSSQFR